MKNLHEGRIARLAEKSDHKTLATWALDCAERALPLFESTYPKDVRPRVAIETGRTWVKTGVFSMAVIRKASLDSHSAARKVKDDSARSAARAAGQAVASAHVPTHALAAAGYAAAAIRDSSDPDSADSAATEEREWQYQHLMNLGRPRSVDLSREPNAERCRQRSRT